MAVSTKMSVDVSGFTSGMQQAQASLKAVNAMLKQNKAALKVTGNTEAFVQAQTSLLNKKLTEQQKVVDRTTKTLQEMEKKGVNPTSAAFVNMQTKLAKAQTDVLNTQLQIQELGNKSGQAAEQTDKLSNSVASIGKKLSVDQVISGINSITKVMENAAKTAIHLAEKIWGATMDSAGRGDDIATGASVLGMDIEEYQRYAKVFATEAEITVAEWQKAKAKVQKAINDPSAEQTSILELLGIQTHDIHQGKYGAVEGAARDFEEVFWEIGETLRQKVASGELTQDLADTYANALFGKSFANLNPIFGMGQEGFQQALKKQNVTTEEAIKKLAEMNDTIIKLQGDYKSLQDEILAGMAPALTKGAETLDSLLARVMEYLQTPEGKEALKDLETAVSGLFDDLGKIDPEQVVSGFTSVFNTVVGSVQWLSENWESVVTAMEGILIGWGALEVTGGILEVVKIVSGVASLTGAEAAGVAAGAAWGKGFAAAIMKAAPWLIGVYEMLKPSGSADNNLDTLFDENGNITDAGKSAGYRRDNNGDLILDRTEIINEAAQKAWDLYRTNQLTSTSLEELRKVVLNDNHFKALMDEFMNFRNSNEDWKNAEDIDLTEFFNTIEPPKIEVDPYAKEGANKELAEEIGTVTVPTVFVPAVGSPSYTKRTPGMMGTIPGFANGIWSVPTDNYLAFLHRGEQVVPARQVQTRNYSSNMYINEMIMQNGTDAQGLADSVAAAQRRQISAYGG